MPRLVCFCFSDSIRSVCLPGLQRCAVLDDLRSGEGSPAGGRGGWGGEGGVVVSEGSPAGGRGGWGGGGWGEGEGGGGFGGGGWVTH